MDILKVSLGVTIFKNEQLFLIGCCLQILSGNVHVVVKQVPEAEVTAPQFGRQCCLGARVRGTGWKGWFCHYLLWDLEQDFQCL